MRAKNMRAELANLASAIIDTIMLRLAPEVGRLKVALSDLRAEIERIEPVSVELDQALADRIADKMHGPLTIPQHFSDWIREQAQFHDITRIDPLGYGPLCATVTYVLKADGRLYLEIRDAQGADLWRGTFSPPSPARES